MTWLLIVSALFVVAFLASQAVNARAAERRR